MLTFLAIAAAVTMGLGVKRRDDKLFVLGLVFMALIFAYSMLAHSPAPPGLPTSP